MRNNISGSAICIILLTLVLPGCSKLLEIAPPIDSVTTEEIFANNKQAEWTIAAIYSKMVNGDNSNGNSTGTAIAGKVFSSGLSTIMAGLSADELTAPAGQANTDVYAFTNKLTVLGQSINDKTALIWESCYRIIFDCNASMEGIQASTSSLLTDSVRKQLTGEALAIRSFCFFYLVNFYGDVPLVLVSDFKKMQSIPRSPVTKVYDQIKADLVKAKSLLAPDYSAGNNERVRVNKWFAEALLARVYLYTGENDKAIGSASEVINQSSLYMIESLNNTFLPNNMETIFQLKPATDNPYVMTGTPEGYTLYTPPVQGLPYQPGYEVSNQLAAAFDQNDQRKALWMEPAGTAFVAAKYTRTQKRQYYNVIRLAEMYLIRAEATLLYNPANKANAIEDLNKLRRRAGITELTDQLTNEEVIAAIAHERRTELFLEWGHRWFDLKRTGKAAGVLSAVSYKQPWWGDYQLLYPIPVEDIASNSKLIQNPEYNSR